MKKITIACSILSFLSFSVTNSLAQNVGVGVNSSLKARLQVNGAIGATSAIFGGESTGISVQRNWPAIGFNQYYNEGSRYISNGFAAVQYLDPVSGYFVIDMFPNGVRDAVAPSLNRALVIGSNGNVGIRTGPANASLLVLKSGNAEGAAVFSGTEYASHFYHSELENTHIRAGKTGGKVYLNDIPNGKIIMGYGNTPVGISNGIPSYALEVRQYQGKGIRLTDAGGKSWEFRVQESFFSGYDLNLLYQGAYKGFFASSDGSYLVYSDQRLKKDISPLPLLLEKFMQLQPVSYQLKDQRSGHPTLVGFVAQDVKKLFPELVSVMPPNYKTNPGIGNVYGISYNGFSPLSVKALQEQQQMIRWLERQNLELERRITAAEQVVKSNQ